MNYTNRMKNILILNALIWAAVILLSSSLFRDTEAYSVLLGVLAVGFTLQNGFTYVALKKLEKIEK